MPIIARQRRADLLYTVPTSQLLADNGERIYYIELQHANYWQTKEGGFTTYSSNQPIIDRQRRADLLYTVTTSQLLAHDERIKKFLNTKWTEKS